MIDYKFNVNSNEYLPLRDVVFNTLKEAILSGKLMPGERLMENQLAEKLGVSRTPIREALRMLELENLVELVPRKGAQVLDITEKDIKNVLEIRCVLESLASELACQKMQPSTIAELKKQQEEFTEACLSKDYEKAAEADEKFHDLIFNSTENIKLIQIVNNLRLQLFRYRLAYFKVPTTLSVPIEQHNEIIWCIENHMAEKASEIATRHVKKQTEVILSSVKRK